MSFSGCKTFFSKNCLVYCKSVTVTHVPQWYYLNLSFDDKFSCLGSISSVQMIKRLRSAEFKPFVVFVKPPAIERLSETRKNAKFMSGKDDKGSARPFKVREHLSDNKICVLFSSMSQNYQGLL